jgi:hypothetical protein
MKRGVGEASNAVGLLTGQTTKRETVVSVEGLGVGLFIRHGLKIRDRVASVPGSYP